MSQEIDHENAERLAALLGLLATAHRDEDDEEEWPLSIDTLDGYLHALACGPLQASPLDAMDALFGTDWAVPLQEQELGEDFVEALEQRWSEIVDALEPQRLGEQPEFMQLEPLITEFDEATKAELLAQGLLSEAQLEQLPAAGALWCEGFLMAVQDMEDDWYVFDDDSQPGQMLGAMLLAIAAVALPEGEQRQAYIAEAYDEDVEVDQDVLLDDALFSVQDLRLFWLQAPGTQLGE